MRFRAIVVLATLSTGWARRLDRSKVQQLDAAAQENVSGFIPPLVPSSRRAFVPTPLESVPTPESVLTPNRERRRAWWRRGPFRIRDVERIDEARIDDEAESNPFTEVFEGEAGKKHTVLLATEKAFAAEAVTKIETILSEANYTLNKLENYKSKDDLLAVAGECDAMIIRSDIVDAEVVDKAAKLKVVVRAGAGYDNIDLKSCAVKNVVAMNTPGQNANAVAELVFGMMLTSARNNYDGSSGFELSGRTIGLYGFGAVGRAVFKLAQGFGMKAFAYAPSIPKDVIAGYGATPVDTVEELFDCQYVSLHVPLTPETKESINKQLLSKMPKGGTLINTARMEIVQEDELMEVLTERPDFSYLCDVGCKKAEEVKALVGDEFMKRVIFTKKKMGAQTAEANINAGVAAANQIVNFFEKGDVKFQVKG